MADYWGVVGIVGSVCVIVVALLALILMALKLRLGLAGTNANVGEVAVESWHTHHATKGTFGVTADSARVERRR